jgi:cell division protein FtsB
VEREEQDDESEWDESEDEGGSDDDDDSDYEEDDNIDIITERFMKKGYDAMDLVTLLLGKVKKSNIKYTKEYVKKMVDDFDNIVDEIEAQKQEVEGMAAEDTRLAVNSSA